jgi:competence protein ComEC
VKPTLEAAGGWRLAALAGVAAGLALAPTAGVSPPPSAIAAAPLALAALAATRPRPGAAMLPWLCLVSAVGALAGLLVGGARVEAIDAGALQARPGAPAALSGTVVAPPRRSRGEVSVRVETTAGRVLVVSPEPVPELPVGGEISARGVLEPPDPWWAGQLRRHGISITLRTDRIDPEAGRRGGLEGRIDAIRERAERALERGMPGREAALARGFVLGQDDQIDARTREDFKRSGLAHLLAVSGQNVILLALLAWPLLALLGLTLRARLLAILALIAVYVPVTGAGPSIQRAAVMGGAGLVAALADRPSARWYALLLAAALTLLANPRASGDVGWQLSFAAVIGIMLWSARLARSLGGDAPPASPRRALAEGVAMTVAATAATAPLMAHHFDAFSIAALPANLLALPAVAPAMWLGMLTGMAGQIPAFPVEPLNWVDSLCLAYIGQVARWLGSPGWALLELPVAGLGGLAAAYAVLFGAGELVLRWLGRRRGLALAGATADGPRADPRGRRLRLALAGLAATALLLSGLALVRGTRTDPAADAALSVRVLDVGQGDAILLDPPAGAPVLVDAGPPGSGLADRLRELGVESLAAVVITHAQSDHAGGLPELLEAVPTARLYHGVPDPGLRRAAIAGGAVPVRLAEGGEIASGSLRLTAIWPPAELTGAPLEDPNRLSLVLVAEWLHLSLLLTGDAEAEAAGLEPGPVDVLKVAHHGSEDAGLGTLLERAVPELAVISVGENPYGHPTPETLAELRERRVPTLRTDDDGEIAIVADQRGWRLER